MQPLLNKLVKEHKFNALAKDSNKVVSEVVKRTDFQIEKEIYRNFDTVKGKHYLRSLIYDGTYQGKRAVLKFHGTEGISHDADEIKKFERQNKSKIIRAPLVYARKKWDKRSTYGFTIFEYVNAPEIFNRPFPTRNQLKNFIRFYQEYRTRSITEPWIEPPKTSKDLISDSIYKYTNDWLESAKALGRLKKSDYSPMLDRFHSLVPLYAGEMSVEFMHMHLYPEHIRRLSDGAYVLLDHMSWGYRLQWADLSYMLWRSMLDIRDNSYSFDELSGFANSWIRVCKEIPLTKGDRLFDKKIKFLILERIVGIIIGDLGGGKYWGTKEGQGYFKHMLELNQELFDYFAEELE